MNCLCTRLVTACALLAAAGIGSMTACTRTTERVVVPVGGGGEAASPAGPDVGDGGLKPIGPIAHPVEPDEDFRLVRAPEFGNSADKIQHEAVDLEALGSGLGGMGTGGAGGGVGGSDHRPVSASGGDSTH